MFLKARAIAKGEIPSLNVDFVTNIVPQDDEETLGNQGHAKIVVSYIQAKKAQIRTCHLAVTAVGDFQYPFILLPEGKLANQAAI